MLRWCSRSARAVCAAAVATLVALLTAESALCQTVRGTLLDQGTGQPIGGAFIVLLDEQGERPGRDIGTLTGDDGRFQLRPPEPGRYRLRAERIGFRSTLSEVIEVEAGATVEVTIVAPVEAIELAALAVTGERVCDVPPEAGRETAAVWEEARKALSVVDWSEQQVLRYRVLRWERELAPHSLRVREERTWPWYWNARGGLFTTRPAEDLAEHGYVRPLPADSFILYAPDAAVVLSESFADQHCFAVRQGRGDRAGLIGLGFEPGPGRDLPDIEGVLWLDKETAELRDLEFRYKRLPLPVWDDDIGGDVEFERLPSGAWIISRWSIRSPIVEFYEPLHPLDDRYRLAAIREDGGAVMDIRTRDGERVRRSVGATLAGFVYDSTRAAPLAGARVYLVGTDRAGETDENGRFEIDGLLDGEYSVGFSHPSLRPLSYAPQPVQVTLRRGRTTEIRLAVPGPRIVEEEVEPPAAPAAADRPPGLEARVAREQEAAAGQRGVVLGRVVDGESGRAIEMVEVRLVGAVESVVRVTDGEGAFLFPRVRPGPYEVVLEHLAYGSHTDTVEVGEGELLSYEARLVMEPIELAALTVTVRRRDISPMLLGFYERMSMDLGGYLITREDIERRQPNRISQMIAEAPGARVRCPGGRCYVIFARYERDRLRGACRPAVYVDGTYVFGGRNPPAGTERDRIDDYVIPTEVEAVEVYDSPGSLPAEFGGSRAGCGVVLIWTRRGG